MEEARQYSVVTDRRRIPTAAPGLTRGLPRPGAALVSWRSRLKAGTAGQFGGAGALPTSAACGVARSRGLRSRRGVAVCGRPGGAVRPQPGSQAKLGDVLMRYRISKETCDYVEAAITNNKFTLGLAIVPFFAALFSLDRLVSLNSRLVEVSITTTMVLFFLIVVYSGVRLSYLHAKKATILHYIAFDAENLARRDIEISRPPKLLGFFPLLAMGVGYGSIVWTVIAALWA